jgi:UDPglucose--hexose-1-phosphate uridylyltransferase
VGRHEVIIESPRHNTCPALETPEEVARTIRAFQARGADFAQDPRIEQIIFFKNHGPQAGTSLAHPHTQIVGLPVVPYHIRTRAEDARRYFDDTGRCALCEMWRGESEDGKRVISQNEHFIAFIPYAAFSPFHTWIMPRRHCPNLLEAAPDEVNALGHILRDVLRRLYIGLHDPDYNYVIRSAPLRDPGREYLHWYTTIIPHVTKTAGFEMGSGMFINVALPEESAAFLRGVRVEE